MPLLLTQLCDLLSALESTSKHDPPMLPARQQEKYRTFIKEWFASYKISIHSHRIDAAVLLSALFPAKRTDRVYNIQIPRLTKTLKRCLRLGLGRQKHLDQWQHPGRGDLGDCVARVLQEAEHPEPLLHRQVTVQQVDDALAFIASRSRFSGPKARRRFNSDDDAKVLDTLTDIYLRLQSREAKWFTRMILKDYSNLDLDKYRLLIYSCIDPRLPVAMQIYDDFEAAMLELRGLPSSQTADAGLGVVTRCGANDAHLLPPRIGIKVGPPKWIKAKGGVKHAASVINGRRMSIERKHDGEYCQIHIDLSKGDDCIQIFSKSGKDSTADRSGVHETIKRGLRIGHPGCGFSDKCILEGELLIWSDETNSILEFHKIRKHISRSGIFLGTNEDSQPHPHEHMMIMVYDLLLVDDCAVLHLSYRERRQHLARLVAPIDGRFGVIAQIDVDFAHHTATARLKRALAKAFVRRWEGLVLKPVDESYFSLQRGRSGFQSPWIKMKKDCISGLGDTADFAVVGAGYDSKRAKELDLPAISWTHFFIGCLKNKNAVLHTGCKPEFLIVDCVTNCIKKEDLQSLSQLGKFVALEVKGDKAAAAFSLDFVSMDPRLPKLLTIFHNPFVFELAGSGFDKAPNRNVFTLRFPRVLKIRWDRSWKDTVDLGELQAMADEARSPAAGDIQEEVAVWVKKLDDIDQGSRGRFVSCDETEEEDEESDAATHVKDDVKISKLKPAQNSHKAQRPPLLRMDTGEMHAGERRLDSGEVIGCPASEQLTKSEASLPTPPTSSPLLTLKGNNEKSAGSRLKEVTPNRRKRSISAVGNVQGYNDPKRTMLAPAHNPASKPAIDVISRKDRPLQEINNCARPPSSSPQFTAPKADTQQPAKEFGFVPKKSVGASDLGHSRKRKFRSEELPSSPGRQTTADEYSTAPSTQHTTLSIFSSTQVPPPQEPMMEKPSLPTTPSTADPPPTMTAPNLQECIVMLSSSFDSEPQPAIPAFKKRDLTFNTFSEGLKTITSPADHADSVPHQEVILLIQSELEDASSRDLLLLAAQAPLWQPHTISMWDHHLLQIDERNNGREDDKLKDLFYARVSWRSHTDGGQDGEVKVHWRSGDVDVVTARDMMCLRESNADA